MYLEISGKKSGKTTRLVEAVREWLNKDPENTAVIVTPETNPQVVLQNFEPVDFPRLAMTLRMVDLPENLIHEKMKFFVDDAHAIEAEHLEVSKSAYYAAESDSQSPFIDELLKTTKGKFKSF